MTPTTADHAPFSLPPPVQMFQMLSGYIVTQLLHVAAELGIADQLANGPRRIEDVAAAVGADKDALYRVLRTLCSLGVFTEMPPHTFALTPIGATLRTGVPGSMRDIARIWSRDHYRAFADLVHTVRTGERAFDYAFGTDWWTHLSQHPEEAGIFNAAMGNLAREIHLAALDTYDLSETRRLVDVGGGHGYLVSAILQRYSQTTAVVFDLPHVVEGATPVLAEAGLLDRAEVTAGNFFEAVPAGADTYVLSMIIHDWSDTEAARILRNIRTAIAPEARVLIVEPVIPEGDTPHFGKIIDIVMLGLLSGRERTVIEYEALLGRAGLRLRRFIPTPSPSSIVEAVQA